MYEFISLSVYMYINSQRLRIRAAMHNSIFSLVCVRFKYIVMCRTPLPPVRVSLRRRARAPPGRPGEGSTCVGASAELCCGTIHGGSTAPSMLGISSRNSRSIFRDFSGLGLIFCFGRQCLENGRCSVMLLEAMSEI